MYWRSLFTVVSDYLFNLNSNKTYRKVHSLRNIALFLAGCIESVEKNSLSCNIPPVVRGKWFSWERKETFTEFDGNSMSQKGRCIDMKEEFHVNYTFVFFNEQSKCHYCVKILVRTVNVLEKIESE